MDMGSIFKDDITDYTIVRCKRAPMSTVIGSINKAKKDRSSYPPCNGTCTHSQTPP